MRYKTKLFNQGLLNYVKKRHLQSGSQTFVAGKRGKALSAVSIRGNVKSPIRNEQEWQNSKYSPNKDKTNEKEVFLQKALEHLAKNKMNLTEETEPSYRKERETETRENREEPSTSNRKTEKNNLQSQNITSQQKVSKTKSINKSRMTNPNILPTNKDLTQIKNNYLNSLKYKAPVNPLVNNSNQFDQPEALKLNIERFFSGVKNIKKEKSDKVRKMIGLFKNKDLAELVANELPHHNMKPLFKAGDSIDKILETGNEESGNDHIGKKDNKQIQMKSNKGKKFSVIGGNQFAFGGKRKTVFNPRMTKVSENMKITRMSINNNFAFKSKGIL
jgi:hypothetical protein